MCMHFYLHIIYTPLSGRASRAGTESKWRSESIHNDNTFTCTIVTIRNHSFETELLYYVYTVPLYTMQFILPYLYYTGLLECTCVHLIMMKNVLRGQSLG